MCTHLQITLEALGSLVVPILTLQRRCQTPFLVGSGTLLRLDSEVFLITAKHVVDELQDRLIVTSGKSGFISFAASMAAYEYLPGRDRDHDICVARMPLEAIQNLHPHFGFAEYTDLSDVDPYDKFTLYAFVGYPHSKNKPRPLGVNEKVELKPYFYCLREFRKLEDLRSKDKSSTTHLAFDAPFKLARDVGLDRNIQPPIPRGISGCGVWMLRMDRANGKILRKSLVAVGIEHLIRDNAFIATRISSIFAPITHLMGSGSKPSAIDGPVA